MARKNQIADYERSVFINCPFDQDYIPILHAITYAVCHAGFIPRSALETHDSGRGRLDKLTEIVRSCQYGIHDLSRVESTASPDGPIPRFNMPFEFGLFLGAARFGDPHQKLKQLTVLDSAPHRIQKTLSDIAGNDPQVHGNDPAKAIACVRLFLRDKNGHMKPPDGDAHIMESYRLFQQRLPALCAELNVSPAELQTLPYWKDLVALINAYLAKKEPPAPAA